MVPILFAKTETDFTHNGIGRLVDTISAEVTEQRNGIYELEMTYPITGKWFNELIQGGIIGVIHDDNHDIQPFDIYKTSAVIDGIVTVNAHHISYRLNNIILEPYTASSASAAVAGITTHSANTNPFTFSTDKNVNASFEVDKPTGVRSILFGQEGSLLDVFGTADFLFDKFSVQMLQHRGSDTGVTVRYGKNLTEIDWTHDTSGTYNALAPYWTDGTETVYLPEIIVQPTTPITPVKPLALDMSDKFESKPSEADLRAAAVAYLNTTEPWNPADNIKIDFLALWQSQEYEAIAPLERVGLCDTVSIYWTDVGIVSEKAKVVKVTYDVLAERFTEIEVGTVSTSYVAITDGVQTPATQVVGKSDILVDSGSVTLTANANSYAEETIVFNTSFAAPPSVMLVLKSTTTATAAVAASNVMLSTDPTTTGFSMRLFNGYSQQITRIVYWVAIGSNGGSGLSITQDALTGSLSIS